MPIVPITSKVKGPWVGREFYLSTLPPGASYVEVAGPTTLENGRVELIVTSVG